MRIASAYRPGADKAKAIKQLNTVVKLARLVLYKLVCAAGLQHSFGLMIFQGSPGAAVALRDPYWPGNTHPFSAYLGPWGVGSGPCWFLFVYPHYLVYSIT